MQSGNVFYGPLWSKKSTFQIVFVNKGCCVLTAKEEKDCADCYQGNFTVIIHVASINSIRNAMINLCFFLLQNIITTSNILSKEVNCLLISATELS